MDMQKLYGILAASTVQLRKGPEVEKGNVGGVEVTNVHLMPHESYAPPEMVKVDVHFLIIGVNLNCAELHRKEFVEVINSYPVMERLAAGPSYIEVGAVIGDQGAALQVFALGKALGLWDVVTPETLGFDGEAAEQMAGSGFVMMTGYHPTAREVGHAD